MDSIAELITRVQEIQRVELTAMRDLAGAQTYLHAQRAYGNWLLAAAETDAALGRLRARVQVLAHMPPTLSDLRITDREEGE